MRNLMIGAVSAVLLLTTPALAQTAQQANPGTLKGSGAYDTAPSAGSGNTGPDGVVRTPPGSTMSPSAGSSGGPLTTSPNGTGTSGSSGTGDGGMTGSSGSVMPGVTTAPSGMGNNTGSTIPRDNQTATGTHCPPGTPNCGPGGNGGSGGQ
ncbi:hypothetical protein [Azospirillum sp. B510]|uniref:hypothetical protein n=1 Tax=Azospirillum sp. (strain B510) TaxID=137722 RepID=UPI0005A5F458|nr:hypothetical protein [Azospirillum sp. B510]